ncbi:MAG: ABC transporter ATP-binding protein [Solirubrobacterales bacterium]
MRERPDGEAMDDARSDTGVGRLVQIPAEDVADDRAAPAPLVSLVDVEKSYRGGDRSQRVLRGVHLQLFPGETVVILGRSGSGKTTLLNVIGALDRADRGEVTSCGLDLIAASTKQLVSYRAKAIGFVFQFYNLLPTLTAAENIEAGLRVTGLGREESRSETHRMLARVGLADAAEKFPNQLSGGEQQRVAIARAFARHPRLLLADEPTGNLDDETAGSVIALVRELAAEVGTGVMLVTHDVSLRAIATRTLQMTHGVLEGHER